MSYLFDDWLSYKTYHHAYPDGYIFNDTELYWSMIPDDMDIDTLMQIQQAQADAYEYLIQKTLESQEASFRKHMKETIHHERYFVDRIDEYQEYLKQYKAVIDDVVNETKHGNLKIGAKYIVPDQYLKMVNKENTSVYHPARSPLLMNIKGRLISLPTNSQLVYPKVEVALKWIARLKELQKQFLNNKDEGLFITNNEPTLEDLISTKIFQNIVTWLEINGPEEEDFSFVIKTNQKLVWQASPVYLRAFHETIASLLNPVYLKNNQRLKRIYSKTFNIDLSTTDAFRTDKKQPNHNSYKKRFSTMPKE